MKHFAEILPILLQEARRLTAVRNYFLLDRRATAEVLGWDTLDVAEFEQEATAALGLRSGLLIHSREPFEVVAERARLMLAAQVVQQGAKE